ncbi:MAG: hypothetical protein RIQ33_2599 [Bacteroidota bacterium]|jgi:hypothetical protein
MKKINKSEKLATEYFHWVKQLEVNKEVKSYDSSNNKFYLDVLINLIVVQNGLCAYTEFRLVEEKEVAALKKLFVKGKFTGNKPESSFEIEHFDSKIKKTKGWNWENLFAVYDSINTKVKRIQEPKLGIKKVLKPDTEKYDPLKFLDYDETEHIFIPNDTLKSLQKKQVKEMITVLGLNWAQIKMKRREFIKEQSFLKEFNQSTNIHQFITAYEIFISKKYKN